MKRRYVSFLDLMCCGFGGALLMFLIVASASSKSEPSQPMLLIRCRASTELDRKLVAAELGLQYRRRGAPTWIRPGSPSSPGDISSGESSDVWYFFPKSAAGGGADAILICNRPLPGEWEVRAYVASTRLLDAQGDRAVMASEEIPVHLEVLGAVQIQELTQTLSGTGSFSDSLFFEVATRD